jgi:hypothetical protein
LGVERLSPGTLVEAEGMAVTADHRALAVGYFNSTWELIDLANRTPEQDRDMVASALASRQHWSEAGGTDQNLTVGDWQVAHVASLAGFADLATAFATAAYDRARSANLPTWLQASTAEGMARAAACASDRAGYDKYAAEARELLAQVDDDEDRKLIESQLASIQPA